MTANRLVVVYSRALAIGGPLLLLAILIADPRWTGQLLEIVVMTVAAFLLRGAPGSAATHGPPAFGDRVLRQSNRRR